MRFRFQAILFDLFDTLCHLDERIYVQGKARSAELLGVDPKRYLKEWMEIQEPCQRGHIASLSERIESVARRLGCPMTLDLLQTLTSHEASVLERCAHLHPDVLPTLDRFAEFGHLRLGLVSNASGSARRILRCLDLEKRFHPLILSCDTGFIKPEPEIYKIACRQLSLAPSQCLFVGDGNGRELEGATDLGMTAVKIHRPDTMEIYRTNPSSRWNHSIQDLQELFRLI